MCGIAGIVRRGRVDAADPSRLVAMTSAIAHRGPDDFGYLLLDSRDGAFQIGKEGFERRPCDVLLGARRLSIIDLTPNGRQPFQNEAGDVFLVFNGEIFNYLELRTELLGLGHLFRSRTDAEVIVHAYEQWGRDCVQRFNGMWAFVIWDQRRRELFCSRDRFGIKPLYYRIDQDAFLFASEIKGILPAMEGRPGANEGVVSDYLLDGSLCRTPDTFFDGVYRLEPAHNLVVSDDRHATHRYWDYPVGEPPVDDRGAADAFRDLLADSVRVRLRSDVPVGVALSGGIDSTSILALASGRDHSNHLKAFTAVFPGQPYDEEPYARLATRHTNAELFTVGYQPSDMLRDLSRVIWLLDYPALDPQVLPRWRLMQRASEHVKVILEGQGADEMLAGYVHRYFVPHAIDELQRTFSGRNSVSLGAQVANCNAMRRQYGTLFYSAIARELAPRWLPTRTLRTRRESNRLYAAGFIHRHRARREPVWTRRFGDRLSDSLHYDHATAVLPMLLKFGDALSMGASIESRLPFLDHRLVELAFRLKAPHKLQGTSSKGVLKEAMRGLIPEEIRGRTDKVGFYTPVSDWMTQGMSSGVRPLLLSRACRERGIFNPVRIERALDRHARGEARASMALFRCLSLEMWYQSLLDGHPSPARGGDAIFTG